MIHLVTKEFKSSKWVDVLEKLIKIRDEEYRDYEDRFLWWNRYSINFQAEILTQLKNVRIGVVWIVQTLWKVFKSIIRVDIVFFPSRTMYFY
jgi:hypothetical protein